MTLFAVNPKKPILECAASDRAFVKVTRRLDPLLFGLNAKGALNGHVPITAIVSFIALAASFVHGFDTVVLSNERSADQGNVTVAGHEVNHQFSKTSGAERELANYIARHVDGGLACSRCCARFGRPHRPIDGAQRALRSGLHFLQPVVPDQS